MPEPGNYSRSRVSERFPDMKNCLVSIEMEFIIVRQQKPGGGDPPWLTWAKPEENK
jgi:hypothetical protein